MDFTIRPLEAGDYESWYPLWQGYLKFYKSSVADDVTQHSYDRIVDPEGDIFGFGAFDSDGAMLGMVTYLFHPFTWSKGPRCYLGDLFTVPEARGKGVARALIEVVCDAAREEGAEQVYWMTQEFNYPGRTLYDKVADKTDFIKYAKNL